jgi:hypothetical protein
MFCESGRDHQPITSVRRKAGFIFLILKFSNSFVNLLWQVFKTINGGGQMIA